MSNRCTNIALISSSDRQVLDNLLENIADEFECYTDIEIESGCCELEFCTNGPFPIHLMKRITDNYQESNLYIQVITYELNDELLEHHVYDKGVWTDKLAGRISQTTKQESNTL